MLCFWTADGVPHTVRSVALVGTSVTNHSSISVQYARGRVVDGLCFAVSLLCFMWNSSLLSSCHFFIAGVISSKLLCLRLFSMVISESSRNSLPRQTPMDVS